MGVYPCLSPCDRCKDPEGWWWGWLKISKLAWGFSGSCSINGSQETSCIYRKGFFMFLSYGTLDRIRSIRLIRLIRGKNRNLQDRGLSLFIALRWMQRPWRGDVGLAENIQACLRDFQTGSASMDRKRHFAYNARALSGFCLTPCRTRSVKSVKSVVKIITTPC